MFAAVGTATAGVVFGLALAAPPGPMNAIIAEESVTRGWIAGFRTGLGAMTADVLFFLFALFGAAAVVRGTVGLEALLFLIGGALMLLFAADALSTAIGAGDGGSAGVPAATTGFRKALLLGLTNPYQLAFWLTVGLTLITPGAFDLGPYVPLVDSLVVETGSPLLLGGFFLGILAWIVGYPGALAAVGERVEAFEPTVAALSGLVLGGFGLLFCWIGVTGLL